jgi:tetratricopeptide (TPR) repeat protein
MKRFVVCVVCVFLIASSGCSKSPAERSGKTRPLTPAEPQALGSSQPEGLPEALALFHQGKIEDAERLLRRVLKEDVEDVSSRLLLGGVVDTDGWPDEAVKIWQEGLTGEVEDFPLLMNIGQVRARQGRDGPGIMLRRGTVTAKPVRDTTAAEKFKRDHLRLAAEAFKKAFDLAPDRPDAARELAAVYAESSNHADAVKLWRRLHEQNGGDVKVALGLAGSLADSGEVKEAVAIYRKVIEIDPRLAEAHSALAKHYQVLGDAEKAKDSQQRAEFYENLPPFTELSYSEENAATLAQLNDGDAVRKLTEDASPRAAEFLAALCWSHPHNELETQAFASLEKRGKAARRLVRQLLENGESTCTIRSSAQILARQKDPGLLDQLLPLLPQDIRAGGFEMDIAGALAELGDSRAVRPLVEQLSPTNSTPPDRKSPESFLIDRTAARARAALALGAFDTTMARQALMQGVDHEQLGPYCTAALYRLTHETKYVDSLRTIVSGEDRYAAYQIASYLRHVDTAEAKQLVVTWESRAAEEEADNDQNP